MGISSIRVRNLHHIGHRMGFTNTYRFNTRLRIDLDQFPEMIVRESWRACRGVLWPLPCKILFENLANALWATFQKRVFFRCDISTCPSGQWPEPSHWQQVSCGAWELLSLTMSLGTNVSLPRSCRKTKQVSPPKSGRVKASTCVMQHPPSLALLPSTSSKDKCCSSSSSKRVS